MRARGALVAAWLLTGCPGVETSWDTTAARPGGTADGGDGGSSEEFSGDAELASTAVEVLQPCSEQDTLFEVLPDAIAWQFVRAQDTGDPWSSSFGAGVALEDFDGDGVLDVYLPNHGAPGTLHLGRGDGTFVLADAPGGVLRANGASAADWDGDGDVDLWVMGDGLDRLLRNDGGTFTDITEQSGVLVAERTLAVAWADLNDDGWLDPFACTFFGAWAGSDGDPAPDMLFLSDGLVGWQPAPEELPGSEQVSGCFAAAFGYADGDGQLDLLTVHDKGNFFAPDRAWLGGDGFEERAEALGLADAHSGMGLVFADFDDDGDDDVWKTSAPWDRLKRRESAGFIDVTAASGVGREGRPETTWDADAWDVDGDGDLDPVVLSSGYDDPGAEPEADDQVWFNDGGLFEPAPLQALGWGPPSVGRSFARGDLDGDGAPDVVLPTGDQGARVVLGRCSGQQLLVDVRTAAGAAVPGARVEVIAGERSWLRTVQVGGQVQSSQPGTVHVAVGEAEAARLVVWLPDGTALRTAEVPTGARVIVTVP